MLKLKETREQNVVVKSTTNLHMSLCLEMLLLQLWLMLYYTIVITLVQKPVPKLFKPFRLVA